MSLMDLIRFHGLIWKQPGFACFHDRDHSSDTLPRKCRGIKETLLILASGGQGTRLCENPGNTDTIPRKHSRICLGHGGFTYSNFRDYVPDLFFCKQLY